MNVIIVTSSLMKDMNSKTDMYRANAIRVLCRITDGTLLTQIERYFKQAIVDKNPVVASAALVSGIHLLQTILEIVKRWSNEVTEAVQSRSAFVQFHALALLHQVAMTHPMAVTNCNIDMESLLSDQNRSTITTLLKTGNESSVDRLMKQITNFMSDIADEFKIVVVEAIRSLCLKFPLKYRSLKRLCMDLHNRTGFVRMRNKLEAKCHKYLLKVPKARSAQMMDGRRPNRLHNDVCERLQVEIKAMCRRVIRQGLIVKKVREAERDGFDPRDSIRGIQRDPQYASDPEVSDYSDDC
ncbi:hypothetical protein RHMOL_Rhmol08G0167800 [Rhododendron molle]|uniref:Uncharacterized protein n=1 Tax=Rhododendron molle TaxID=49168 RepID=A0ACC0MP89_RHOML|nr:hypothetical protein RHMOL_Rhmol08G0167800 [Rhododendron molle]